MYTPFFATCMVIQIPPSGQIFVGRIGNTGNFCLWGPEYMKFLFVGSGIMKVLFVGSGIQQIFVCGIRILVLWNLQFSSRNLEPH